MTDRNDKSGCDVPGGGWLPLIGVTMGDPGGVGAELIVRVLDDVDLRRQGRFAIYGLHEALSYAADRCEISPFWFRRPHEAVNRVGSGVVVADFDEYPVFPGYAGIATRQGAQASQRFVTEAASQAGEGMLDAIVTVPVREGRWRDAGIPFDSEAAMLADVLGVRRLTRMLIGGPLRVALASDREPFFALWHRFAIGVVFQPIDQLNDVLRTCFGLREPRIGVCSLNPSGTTHRRFGDEERRIIEPAILMAQESGMDVDGPLPAADIFGRPNGNGYDGVVALYHDQGAVAARMAAPGGGVVATLGLPVIHLAPQVVQSSDAGGPERVGVEPMKDAIRLACEMARRHRAHRRAVGRRASARARQ